MTWIAILIAVVSAGISVGTLRRNKAILRALQAEKRENDELKSTLVEVLDEEGNIRGQLALPGRVTTKGVSDRLAIAEKSVSTIQDEIKASTKKLRKDVTQMAVDLREAKGELEAARSRENKLSKTLAEVVDGDGTVLAQLRLPGEKVASPDRTPCGDMCKLAHYIKPRFDVYGKRVAKGSWRCKAGQDMPCDDVRHKFEDADGQCVLFERDDDC